MAKKKVDSKGRTIVPSGAVPGGVKKVGTGFGKRMKTGKVGAKTDSKGRTIHPRSRRRK